MQLLYLGIVLPGNAMDGETIQSSVIGVIITVGGRIGILLYFQIKLHHM